MLRLYGFTIICKITQIVAIDSSPLHHAFVFVNPAISKEELPYFKYYELVSRGKF